jgi:hypothetical protein
MRRFLAVLSVYLVLACVSAARQAPDSSPASKEDIDKVFQALHLRDTMKMMMDVTGKQQRQLMHEQLKKSMSTANLPPDFEARVDKMMDDTLKNFPMEEMLQVMAPVYQKHLSKGDADAMVAFYSTATGQKLIRELPAITQEAMQAAYPILQKQMAATMERVKQEVAEMTKENKAKPGPGTSTPPN